MILEEQLSCQFSLQCSNWVSQPKTISWFMKILGLERWHEMHHFPPEIELLNGSICLKHANVNDDKVCGFALTKKLSNNFCLSPYCWRWESINVKQNMFCKKICLWLLWHNLGSSDIFFYHHNATIATTIISMPSKILVLTSKYFSRK